MQLPLELEVQVIANASSGYTLELIEQRLLALAGRDDEKACRERGFLLGLKARMS